MGGWMDDDDEMKASSMKKENKFLLFELSAKEESCGDTELAQQNTGTGHIPYRINRARTKKKKRESQKEREKEKNKQTNKKQQLLY